jgi:hypothetical protein
MYSYGSPWVLHPACVGQVWWRNLVITLLWKRFMATRSQFLLDQKGTKFKWKTCSSYVSFILSCMCHFEKEGHHPQRDTCTGVRAIRFLGAYSRLLALSARPAQIKFLVADAVRGTALRTSACIDCVRLHRTYTWDISCEWSHWCLEHRFLRRVQSVLCICAYFIIVYCLYA